MSGHDQAYKQTSNESIVKNLKTLLSTSLFLKKKNSTS